MTGAGSHREICDERILGLAGSVGDETPVSVARGQLHRVQRLGDAADLVQFDQDRVANSFVDPLLQDLRVRAGDVISDQLNLRSKSNRQISLAVPIVFSHAVFEQHDRILLRPRLPQTHELV